MAKKNIVYIPAPSCPNGKHELVDAAPPRFVQCVHCKTRFALVSEEALNKLGIMPIERALTKH